MLKHLRVGPRLWVGFGLLIATLVAIATLSIVKLAELDHRLRVVVEDRYAKVEILGEVTKQVNLGARATRNMLIFQEPAAIKEEAAVVDGTRQAVDAQLDKLGAMLVLPGGRKLFDVVAEKRSAYSQSLVAFNALVLAGKQDEGKRLLTEELRPRQLVYFEAIDKMVDYQKQAMAKTVADAQATFESARAMLIAATLAAIGLAVGASFAIARSITAPMAHAKAAAAALASGDLTCRLQVDARDEIGETMAALNVAMENLNRTIGTVRDASQQVNTGSAELSAGNLDLSSRTEEQAASLQETASAVEQLTGTVRTNADAARESDRLATEAAAAARASSDEVRRVVGTMGEIAEASRKISSIISVIDGIAFQTNILALNAAVEAARAGEQGRGFAVVAGEVRTLAQRSTEAAREIKALIERSAQGVEAGVQAVDAAGTRIEQLSGSVGRLGEIIGSVSSASQEQAGGLEQVNTAVSQMDQVTQQNAALVEQLAATGKSLSDQSDALMKAVAGFRTTA